MGGLVTHRNVPIDETSRAVLAALVEAGGVGVPSELRSTVGLDDREQVRFRLSEYLLPAGLVEPVGSRPIPGGDDQETVFAVTDDGQSFLKSHDVDTDVSTPALFGDSGSDDVSEDLRSLSSDVQTLQSSIANLDDTLSEFGSRLTRLEGQVSDLERSVEQSRAQLDSHEDAIKATGKRVEATHSRVDSLSDEIEEVAAESERARELVIERIRDAMADRDERFNNELRRLRTELKEMREDNEGLF
jgi:predicted  nucleic acid-binding Zn-ribbon protein